MSTQALTDEQILSYLPKEASKHDRETFLHICRKTGLDPVLKQILALPRKNKKPDGTWVTTITFQTSIDGYRLISERTGKYSPGKESTYTYDKEGKLFSATSYIKKMTEDGTWHEVGATAIYSEYAQTVQDKETGVAKPTQFWAKMGHVMLAKCAEALAHRKAFPALYNKLYTDDEMMQAKNDEDEEPKINLPENVTEVELNSFLDDFTKKYKTTTDKVKERILVNPEPFWELFNNWKKNHNEGMLQTA